MLTKKLSSSSLRVSTTSDNKMQFGWDTQPAVTVDNYYNHKLSQQTANAQICSQLQLVT